MRERSNYLSLFIVFRQLSADSKTINYKINSGFVSPEVPKARANKTDIKINIFFILVFVENCL